MCLDSLKFLALGDWGGIPTYPYYLPPEKAVGEQMGAIAADFQTQFVLALGDNFYFEGVKDVEDKRFFVSRKFFFPFYTRGLSFVQPYIVHYLLQIRQN